MPDQELAEHLLAQAREFVQELKMQLIRVGFEL